MNIYSLNTTKLDNLNVGNFIISRNINPFFNAEATGKIIAINDGFITYSVYNFSNTLRIKKNKLIGSYVVINDRKHLIKY